MVAAIEDHARRRDIDHPPHAVRQATGKHVLGSANVDIVEIDTPAPGRGERTGMADRLDARAGSFYSHPIPQISSDGGGASGNELLRPRGREVSAKHMQAVALRLQRPHKVLAKKSCSACNENLHMTPY